MTLGLIINTRPSVYHDRFHEAFGDLPWAIFNCPLTRPQPTSATIPSSRDFDSLIFTSQIAVGIFLPDAQWTNKRVFAVGSATADAARRAGFHDVVQTGQNVDDLRNFLSNDSFGSALYPSATEVSAELEREYAGRIVRRAVYEMISRNALPEELVAAVRNNTPIVAPLFSRQSARFFANLFESAGIVGPNTSIATIGISQDVFTDSGAAWQNRTVAAQPTIEALVVRTGEAIENFGA